MPATRTSSRFSRRRVFPTLLALVLFLPAYPAAAGPGAAAASEAAEGEAVWSKLANAPAPDARIEHSMVYAPEFGLVIVFGGLTSHGRDSDLWMIRPGDPQPTWSSPILEGPAPGPRTAASAVWDSGRHRLIVFGGIADQPNGARDGYNDVWALEFDAEGTATGWVELYGGEGSTDVYGATAPIERWGASAVYDSERQRLIIHGGSNRQSNAVDSVPKRCLEVVCLGEAVPHSIVEPWGFPDMWSFDLAGSDGWEMLDADGPKQTFLYAIYDAEYDRMVTINSYGPNWKDDDEPPPPPDVRSVDLATNEWTDWPDPAQEIRPGLSSAWAYDEATRTVLAAGWEWDPHPKFSQSIYALHLDQPGSEATRWERLPGRSPDPEVLGYGGTAAVVVPDEQGGSRFVAFGGSMGDSNGSLRGPVDLQMYGLDTGEWSSVSGAPLLNARSKHTTILDERRRQLYVIGGTLGGEEAQPDGVVWRLDIDDGRWEGLPPSGEAPPKAISPGTSTMAVYDPAGDRILQLPNCGEGVFALDLETTTWSRLATAGEVPRVCGANLVYDSKRARVLLLNGYTVNGSMWCFVSLDCLTKSPYPADTEHNRVVYSLDLAGETPTWRVLRSQNVSRGALDRGTAAVYDSLADRVLLLTTDAGTYQEPAGNSIVESLSFADGDQGTWSVVGSSAGVESAPAPRTGSQAVFDEANGQMVIWGGATEWSTNPADPGVYSFRPPTAPSGALWGVIPTPGTTPSGRVYGSATYDEQTGSMITFGGQLSMLEGASRDVHALTLSTPPQASEEAMAGSGSSAFPGAPDQPAISSAGPFGVCTPGTPTIDDRCEDGRFVFDLGADADIPMAQALSPSGDRLYVTGTSWDRLSNSHDIVTVAFDPAAPPGAMTSWVAQYDGGSYLDVPYGIAVSPDGSKIFVTGTSRSFRTDYDFVTIAYERQTGHELWVATHDGTGPADEGSLDVPAEVLVSPDGSQVYVTGTTRAPNGEGSDHDYTTVAYDAETGERSWVSTYSGQQNNPDQGSIDVVTDAVLAPDGDTVYVLGATGLDDRFVIGTVAIETATGHTKWVSRLGESGVNLPRSIGVSPDGDRVFVTGGFRRPGRQVDYDLMTLAIETGEGKQVWMKLYAGAAAVDDGRGFNQGRALAVAPSGDRVYVTGPVAGEVEASSPEDGHFDYATIAYSTGTGARLWDSHYSVTDNDMPAAIATSPDGGKVYVTGSSFLGRGEAGGSEDMATISYDSSTGAQSWAARYEGAGVNDTPLDFEKAVGISVGTWGGQTVIYSLSERSGPLDLPATSDYVVAIYREGD